MTDSDAPLTPEQTPEPQAAAPAAADLAAALSARPEAAPEAAAQPTRKIVRKTSADGGLWGTGRRKSSVARVRIRPGDGKFLVNKREVANFFCVEQDRNAVLSPLIATQSEKRFDIFVNVRGGGTTGQAGAIRMGLARALLAADADFEPTLRDKGYLTRDSRVVERKKPGQKKARKRFQFSKR